MIGLLEKRNYTLVIACAYLFLPGKLLAKPDFPAPPEASVEWVGKNMDLNGIRSDIRAFHTKKSFEKVSSFYRKEWSKPVEGPKGEELPGYTETDQMVPWRLFTRIEDGYLMTAQFQEADRRKGTWGYLAISPLPDPAVARKRPELGTGIPKMKNSQVISELKNKDVGKDARTMIIYNTHSVGSNVSYYRNHYRAKGYSVEMDTAVEAGKMHSLVFKSGRKRITIMLIGDHNDTRVVINDVTHSIL